MKSASASRRSASGACRVNRSTIPISDCANQSARTSGLKRPASFTRDAFVHGASNALALAAIDAWPGWAGGCLALVGPQSAGKTHLARAWAENADAVTLDRLSPDVAAAAGRLVLLEDVDPDAPDHDDLLEIRRMLYGLHAVLVLHFAQEDESYLSLADDAAA